MAANDDTRRRAPLDESRDRPTTGTSGNREESMKESGKDAFGRGTAVRNPESESQGDGSTQTGDASPRGGRSGKQSPSSSGTESLGGENRDSSRRGPGGTEGQET